MKRRERKKTKLIYAEPKRRFLATTMNETYEQNGSQTIDFFLIPYFKQNWLESIKILLSTDNDHLNGCFVFNIQGFLYGLCNMLFSRNTYYRNGCVVVVAFSVLKAQHTNRFIQIDKQVRVCIGFVRKKTVWTHKFMILNCSECVSVWLNGK